MSLSRQTWDETTWFLRIWNSDQEKLTSYNNRTIMIIKPRWLPFLFFFVKALEGNSLESSFTYLITLFYNTALWCSWIPLPWLMALPNILFYFSTKGSLELNFFVKLSCQNKPYLFHLGILLLKLKHSLKYQHLQLFWLYLVGTSQAYKINFF